MTEGWEYKLNWISLLHSRKMPEKCWNRIEGKEEGRGWYVQRKDVEMILNLRNEDYLE